MSPIIRTHPPSVFVLNANFVVFLAVRQTVEEDDEDAQLKELQAALAM